MTNKIISTDNKRNLTQKFFGTIKNQPNLALRQIILSLLLLTSTYGQCDKTKCDTGCCNAFDQCAIFKSDCEVSKYQCIANFCKHGCCKAGGLACGEFVDCDGFGNVTVVGGLMFTIIVICGHSKKLKQIRKNKYVLTNVVHPMPPDGRNGKVRESKFLENNLLAHGKNNYIAKSQTDNASDGDSGLSGSHRSSWREKNEGDLSGSRHERALDEGLVVFKQTNMAARNNWHVGIGQVILSNRELKKFPEIGTPVSSKEEDQETPFKKTSGYLSNRHEPFSPNTVNAGDQKDRGGSRKWTEFKKQDTGVQRKGRRT
jgi:hypothetical protein